MALIVRARGCSIEEQLPFPGVSRECRGALEFRARFIQAPEAPKEIAAHARQQVIVPEHRLGRECIDQIEPGLRPMRHGHGDRAIQLDHR